MDMLLVILKAKKLLELFTKIAKIQKNPPKKTTTTTTANKQTDKQTKIKKSLEFKN